MTRAVFISHSHDDANLAKAVEDFLFGVFGNAVTPRCSSSTKPGAGVPGGVAWRTWIKTQVAESYATLVVLTPRSVQRPWPMWEVGAVTGAALATREDRPVVPMLFRVHSQHIPDPLRELKCIDGTSLEEIRQFLDAHFFVPLANEGHYGTVVAPAHHRLSEALTEYARQVEALLLDTPMALNEGAIVEWCDRLDALSRAGRLRETEQVHRWIRLAFGRSDGSANGRPDPLDLRLHRRLGEMYLRSKQYEKAVNEFRLARALAPRDIYVLRSLGEVLVKKGDLDAAREVLDTIEKLDPTASEENAECAGLNGAWFKKKGQVREAREAYRKGLQHNQDSYYLADNVGQLSLRLNDLVGAKEAFGAALDAIARSHESSTWSRATEVAANIAIGNYDIALQKLAEIARQDATAEQVQVGSTVTGLIDALPPDEKARAVAGLGDWRSKLHA